MSGNGKQEFKKKSLELIVSQNFNSCYKFKTVTGLLKTIYDLFNTLVAIFQIF